MNKEKKNIKEKLTLLERIDLEKEIELLENKIRLRLSDKEYRTKIKQETGIDQMQISGFMAGRRKFAIKRLLQIARVIRE